MEAHMLEIREDWGDYGVTIICDSWTELEMDNEEVTIFKRKLNFVRSDAKKKRKVGLEDV
ncbi:hypothetical protein E2562_003248 [Oryza meyeriana var. granulata]|uniref:DUF659 domain-containing protein n=1 Tax=Oryza meyeriana var. granulata TaxID=110450 RepID=A0A6G1EUX7_9ORYZ|nr:hypothetical protein E2562_003248 [Oryza meyeriana var. granulata]